MPVALDLAGLYEQMLQAHVKASPLSMLPRPGEGVEAMVARANLIRAKERECEKLEVRLHKEIQFNRKVELNAVLRVRRAELAELQQQ